MSSYLDKLAHVQFVIICQFSVAQMCTCKDMLAQYLGAPYLDNVMSHNELTRLNISFFLLTVFYVDKVFKVNLIICFSGLKGKKMYIGTFLD